MKLDGALREVQLRSDLLVGEAAQDPIEDFFFAASQADGAFRTVACFEKLLRFFGKSHEGAGIGGNHNQVVGGRLAANHAMHGEEACGMVEREFAVRSCFDVEVSCASGFLIEEVDGFS